MPVWIAHSLTDRRKSIDGRQQVPDMYCCKQIVHVSQGNFQKTVLNCQSETESQLFASWSYLHAQGTDFSLSTFALPYALHVAHMTLHFKLFLRRPGSIPSLREQPYVNSVHAYFTVTQIKAAFLSVPPS